MPHEVKIRWDGVDASTNAVHFMCAVGNHGERMYVVPVDDVDRPWCVDGVWHVRLSGYLDHTPLEPYRYVPGPHPSLRGAQHAPMPGSTAVADLLAAKKVDAIERLSKAANLLTSTVLNTMGRGTNGPMRGLCPNMLEYNRLIQETRDYYSATLYDALTSFNACAQTAYTELGSLRDEDFHRTPVLHGQVETGRDRLAAAIHKELHGERP